MMFKAIYQVNIESDICLCHFIGNFNGKVLLQQSIYACIFYEMQLEILQLKSSLCVLR